jgi:hypothetical protein
MSSISEVSGNGFNLSQIGSYSPISQPGRDSDGDNDSSRAGKAGGGGKLLHQCRAGLGLS